MVFTFINFKAKWKSMYQLECKMFDYSKKFSRIIRIWNHLKNLFYQLSKLEFAIHSNLRAFPASFNVSLKCKKIFLKNVRLSKQHNRDAKIEKYTHSIFLRSFAQILNNTLLHILERFSTISTLLKRKNSTINLPTVPLLNIKIFKSVFLFFLNWECVS